MQKMILLMAVSQTTEASHTSILFNIYSYKAIMVIFFRHYGNFFQGTTLHVTTKINQSFEVTEIYLRDRSLPPDTLSYIRPWDIKIELHVFTFDYKKNRGQSSYRKGQHLLSWYI